MKIAVLGLFNSGSTIIAGVLDKLGVNMGQPYWYNHYESLVLKNHLVKWWNEPELTERVSREHRIYEFRKWLRAQESQDSAAIGVKHPFLCLSGDELKEAWGEDTRFIWAHRPLEDSIERLVKRQWYGDPVILQTNLWRPLKEFFSTTAHLKIEYMAMRRDSRGEIDRIIDYLCLSTTDEQKDDAVGFVRPPEPD